MSTLPQPIQYQGSNDPRKIAQNQRALVQQRGDQLMGAQGVMQGQAEQQRNQYGDYLNQIERPLAAGQGGYNAQELSQIRMTPQQQQDIITGAGISAGANTAAGVGAAERAANAAGGNPAALAAYRARAAQQIGAQAGDAMTQARIGASNAAAQRAEQIGGARMGQQQAALGQQQQQAEMYNQNAQNAAQRALQAYGTQAGATNQAANLGLEASQTPSTFDKIIGGVGGALSFLDEGDVMGDQDTSPAVVGEGGPEKVVDLSRRRFYQDGGMPDAPDIGNVPSGGGAADVGQFGALPQAQGMPWYKRFASAMQQGGPQQPGTNQAQWNPVSPYKTMVQAAGALGRTFLADGGIAANKTSRFDRAKPNPGAGIAPSAPQGTNGIFTKPTRVNLAKNEAVVPLSYRATAKTRPSMASAPAAPVTKAPNTKPYRAPIRRPAVPAIGSRRI